MPKDSKAEKAKKPGPSTSTEHAVSARHKLRGANVRLSHHKARGRWFQARSAWPVREAPVHMLIRERERAAKSCRRPPWILPGNVLAQRTSAVESPRWFVIPIILNSSGQAQPAAEFGLAATPVRR